MEKKTLLEWRLSKGISRAFIQKALGKCEQSVRFKEEGKRDWDLNEVRTLLKIYNISFEQVAD